MLLNELLAPQIQNNDEPFAFVQTYNKNNLYLIIKISKILDQLK